jgi:hypothetical protein
MDVGPAVSAEVHGAPGTALRDLVIDPGRPARQRELRRRREDANPEGSAGEALAVLAVADKDVPDVDDRLVGDLTTMTSTVDLYRQIAPPLESSASSDSVRWRGFPPASRYWKALPSSA